MISPNPRAPSAAVGIVANTYFYLCVGDDYLRILTMKECIGETRPPALDALLEIPANFVAVSEWTQLPARGSTQGSEQAPPVIQRLKNRLHLAARERPSQNNPRDVPVDESKQADIENLGDCLRALGEGQQLGEFSLTIVLYAKDQGHTHAVIFNMTQRAKGETRALQRFIQRRKSWPRIAGWRRSSATKPKLWSVRRMKGCTLSNTPPRLIVPWSALGNPSPLPATGTLSGKP